MFEHLFIEESFLLGWSKKANQVNIYLELYLLKSHPLFKPPEHDINSYYKLATLNIQEVESTHGLIPDSREPVWDNLLGEYKDIEALCAVDFNDQKKYLSIECDTLSIEVTGKNIVVCNRFSRNSSKPIAYHYIKIALRFCRAKLCKPDRALVKMYSHLQKAKMRLAFFQTSRTMKTGKPLANDYIKLVFCTANRY